MKETKHGGHLTADQIAGWLVEGPSSGADSHLRHCESCQSRLVEAQAPLVAFRKAFVQWSEAHAERSVLISRPEAGKDRSWGQRLWLPAASLAFAAMLMAWFVTGSGWPRSQSAGQPTVSQNLSENDAVLMSQVDTEVSEAVPDALAPLTDLVAWDAGEGGGVKSVTAGKLAVHKKSIAMKRLTDAMDSTTPD